MFTAPFLCYAIQLDSGKPLLNKIGKISIKINLRLPSACELQESEKTQIIFLNITGKSSEKCIAQEFTIYYYLTEKEKKLTAPVAKYIKIKVILKKYGQWL